MKKLVLALMLVLMQEQEVAVEQYPCIPCSKGNHCDGRSKQCGCTECH